MYEIIYKITIFEVSHFNQVSKRKNFNSRYFVLISSYLRINENTAL